MENVGVNDGSVLGSSERTVTDLPMVPANGSLSSAHHFVSLKLTSRNYLFWRTQMLPFLEGQGLLGFIDGSLPFPTESPVLASTADSTPAAVSDLPARQLAWRRQDKAILSMLISSLSEETLRFAVGKGTSRQLWQVIEQTLGSSTRSRALRLLGELQGLRQGDSSISDYLGRAQMLIDELALAGRHVDLDDQNLYVFRGLRPEFRPLVATLARGAPVPLPEVADFLVSQEWICSDDGAALGAPAALAVTRGGHGGRGGSPQNRHGGGRNRGRGGRGRGRSNSGPRCQICNKQGHTAASCWQRYAPTSDPQANVAVSGGDGFVVDSHQWFPDTGATNHATPDPTLLTSSTTYDGPETLRVGNGTGMPIVTVGSTSLATRSRSFRMSDVLHVPGLSSSLLSVQRFATENNVFFEFHPSCFFVKDITTRNTLFKGPASGGLYTWPASRPAPTALVAARSSFVWHMRLGHPHSRVLRQILGSSSLSSFNSSDLPNICSSCQLGKSSRFPLSRVESTSSYPLELIYSDIWGPAPIVSANGFKYFVLFVDDYTRYMWYYPMRAKSDLYAIFDKFRSLVERSFSRKILSFQSDLGGEYKKLGSTLTSLGIRHRQSCAYTHEQNGRVERKHRHVVETGLALMAQSSVPSRFWDYAFETAVYLINKMPTRVLSDKSPHYFLHRSPPSYSYLRVFGCLCFPNLRPYNRNKLQFRSSPCVFLGYPPSFRGYRCLDTNTNKVFICRHVRFDEAVFPFVTAVDSQVPAPRPGPWGVAPVLSRKEPSHVSVHDLPTVPVARSEPHHQPAPVELSVTESERTITEQPPARPRGRPRRSASAELTANESEQTLTGQPTARPRGRPRGRSRAAASPVRSHTMHTRSTGPHDHVALSTTVTPEPTCFTQAVKFPEWRDAMDLEFNALVHNNTWRLVPFQTGMNVVGCKWVFRTKRKADGSVERYKARLVAKGFNQVAGEDFFETFSPVVKPTTVRLLLSLAISRGWTIRQLDIHNAFLNGNLAETVYMRQPPGYEDKAMPGHVCLLQRSLYGLKQAPRAWFTRLHDFLVSVGFSPSKTDVSLFIYSHGNTHLYFLVYVDDILVMGSDSAHVTTLISKLALEFKIRDMGVPSFFLGIETISMSGCMLLSQQRYMKDILKRAGMVDCKPVATPVSTAKADPDAAVPYADPTQYRSFTGALQYLTVTRPDLSYAVNRLCQHMHSPSTADWAALKRVLRYVNGTLHLGLKITSSPSLDIHAYSDSDWAGNPDDRKSTSGFAVFLGSNLVSWVCRKQRNVARSSTEAEYKGLADVSAEVTWLVSLMKELDFMPPSAPKLWCDNLGATYLCANPVFHARTKHIEIDYHFVRDKVAKKELQVNFISTQDQIADIFTKPLSSARFNSLRCKLNVLPHQP